MIVQENALKYTVCELSVLTAIHVSKSAFDDDAMMYLINFYLDNFCSSQWRQFKPFRQGPILLTSINFNLSMDK